MQQNLNLYCVGIGSQQTITMTAKSIIANKKYQCHCRI